MRLILAFILILTVSVSAFAASFTITTTAQQDAALTVLVKERNAALNAQKKPAITVNEYVQIESTAVLNKAVEDARAAVKAAVMKAIESGDAASETQLRQTLKSLK